MTCETLTNDLKKNMRELAKAIPNVDDITVLLQVSMVMKYMSQLESRLQSLPHNKRIITLCRLNHLVQLLVCEANK